MDFGALGQQVADVVKVAAVREAVSRAVTAVISRLRRPRGKESAMLAAQDPRVADLEVLYRTHLRRVPASPQDFLVVSAQSAYYELGDPAMPRVRLVVRFYNLSLIGCRITGWRLPIEDADRQSFITVSSWDFRLRRQNDQVENGLVGRCSKININMILEIPEDAGAAVKEIMEKQVPVRYSLAVDWQLDIDEVGPAVMKAQLGFFEIPHGPDHYNIGI